MDPEVLQPLMEQRRLRGVIALKGLPCTCKTELALRIGRLAKFPVLCIQDFLGGGAASFEGAEADFSPPTSADDIERHHRRAFTALLTVAHRHLSKGVSNCVVIKSSLNTPFELQQLMRLALENTGHGLHDRKRCRLIIIECKIRNKYLWKQRFEQFGYQGTNRSWYRPRSWKEIDKAVDEDDLPPSSDLDLLHHLLKRSDDDDEVYLAWLKVDPFYDLFLSPRPYMASSAPLGDEFNDAIKYLLTAPTEELLPPNPYVADYDELRRSLFGQKLSDAAPKGRSTSSCKGDCVFTYWDRVPKEYEADFCGVCQGNISKDAYTCHFCVTTLHKTCAEEFPIKALQSSIRGYSLYFILHISEQKPCTACKGGGKEFSKECGYCLIQDHLKCHLLPTIFYQSSHQHFLSIQLHNTSLRCKACGSIFHYGLGCKRCAFYCEPKCAFLPLELKHEHGGHEHIMKLMYTRDSMEAEEDPCWCDCCYQDMDPESWFYSCQVCPHYVVHLKCSHGYELRLDDPKMVKFVDQLQSQLGNLRDAGNRIKPC